MHTFSNFPPGNGAGEKVFRDKLNSRKFSLCSTFFGEILSGITLFLLLHLRASKKRGGKKEVGGGGRRRRRSRKFSQIRSTGGGASKKGENKKKTHIIEKIKVVNKKTLSLFTCKCVFLINFCLILS